MAGNIQWCRQLLRRIELPMKQFQQNKHILTTKESKKIIRTRLGLRTTRVPGRGGQCFAAGQCPVLAQCPQRGAASFLPFVFRVFPLLGGNIQPGLLRPRRAGKYNRVARALIEFETLWHSWGAFAA